jgi:hypothetical protein
MMRIPGTFAFVHISRLQLEETMKGIFKSIGQKKQKKSSQLHASHIVLNHGENKLMKLHLKTFFIL